MIVTLNCKCGNTNFESLDEIKKGDVLKCTHCQNDLAKVRENNGRSLTLETSNYSFVLGKEKSAAL